MKTIAMHAELLSLCHQHRTVAPTHWCHDLTDGSLSYWFSGSPNTYRWGAEAVGSAAERLDGEHGREPRCEAARQLLERWDAIHTLLEGANRRLPDRVVVDHDEDEITLIWEAEKLVVVIGPDGPEAPEALAA